MRYLCCFITALALAAPFTAPGSAGRPNVVLIVCDDLNDYVTGFNGHPQASTPNVAKLAESGVAFSRAYSNNPVCAPSRSSFLTGIYAHRSGNLFWGKWFQNPVLKNSKTLMEYFRDNGYHVAGSGKMMHHLKEEVWSEYKHKADYGPHVYDGEKRVAHPSVPKPFGDIGAVDGSFAMLEDLPYADDGNPESGWIYGEWGQQVKPFNPATDPTPDERNAAWAADRIRQFEADESGQPFFIGIGFIRPHTPLHVSRKYYEMFPKDQLQLPVIKAGDAEDTFYHRIFDENMKGLRYFRDLVKSYPSQEEALKAFTQAYLACVTAVDDCIGQVIDAVDNSRFKDNTIIIVTSDHGWNMGEKDYLFKNSPWEESCRVPFVIRAPGIGKPGTVAAQPVSLIDLYPTLADLCGLQGDTRKNDKGAPLSGHSIRPFMEDPENGKWDGPDGALSMIWAGLKGKDQWNPDMQHWSLRTERWRYVRYNTGDEELYDHEADPYEWTNLAGEPGLQPVKEELHSIMLGMRKDSLHN
jgi:iduronate 2-sulfatase